MNTLQTKPNVFLSRIALLVSVGGILYGYDIGVVSGALLFIKKSIVLTDREIGLIVGAVLGGGLIGTLIAGPIGDSLGRRFLIFLSSVIFILGITFILVAQSFFILFLARILLGIGVGVVAVGVPLYVAEIVPSQHRGKYVAFFQLLLTFGILLAYFVDLIFTPSGNWRAMFAILLIPAIILMLGAIILPESPRWLIIMNREDHARKILQKICLNPKDIQDYVSLVKQSLNEMHDRTRDLFSSKLAFPAFLAISIAIFNQLTGINSFLQYAPLILKNSGLGSDLQSMMGSVGIGMLNFIFTIIAMTLIDHLGRRPLLMTGILGVLLSEVYLGSISYFLSDSIYAGILSLIGLILFIIFFAIGPGVVVWLTISELFPTHVRGKGIAICLFFNSLASTLLAIFFIPLSNKLGMAKMYWLFSSFTLGYCLVTYFFLPETKAKSLEDIQNGFLKK